ncbi:MAG: iron-sulfur cluster repair protein YtfE [Planctomycetota bacterium]
MAPTLHDPSLPLATFAARIPAASRVFHRHGLDFCCGGRRSLHEACAAAGLDAHALLRELDAEAAQPNDVTWCERPLPELIEHILTRYHAPLRAELPELADMARKVERVHAARLGVPRGLAAHLDAMNESVEFHMRNEEQVLFPLLRSGQALGALGPIRSMEQEHEEHASDLRRIRALTDDLVAPRHACTTWRARYQRRAQLERDLMDHVHLENNVLFPRALGR